MSSSYIAELASAHKCYVAACHKLQHSVDGVISGFSTCISPDQCHVTKKLLERLARDSNAEIKTDWPKHLYIEQFGVKFYCMAHKEQPDDS